MHRSASECWQRRSPTRGRCQRQTSPWRSGTGRSGRARRQTRCGSQVKRKKMTLETKSTHSRKTLLIYTGPGSGGSTARRIAQLCENVGDVQAILSDDLSCFLALDSASLQHNDNQNNATQIHAVCIPGGSWVQMANFLGELAALCLRTNSESQLFDNFNFFQNRSARKESNQKIC